MARMLASVVVALVVLAGLVIGSEAFAGAVLAVALLATLDVSALLGRAHARPVLPAAAVASLGAPIAVATAPVAAGDGLSTAGWARIPVVFAATVLLAFALVLLFGRRAGAVRGLGGTFVVGVLFGLGAAAVMLLHRLPGGFRLVLGLGVLLAAAQCATPLANWAGALADRRRADSSMPPDGQPGEAKDLRIVPALVAVAVTGALLVVWGDPFLPVLTLGAAAVALVSAVGGQHVVDSMVIDAGAEPRPDAPALGNGWMAALTAGVVVGAPVFYVLARAVAA